jgi:hypothetical protein
MNEYATAEEVLEMCFLCNSFQQIQLPIQTLYLVTNKCDIDFLFVIHAETVFKPLQHPLMGYRQRNPFMWQQCPKHAILLTQTNYVRKGRTTKVSLNTLTWCTAFSEM